MADWKAIETEYITTSTSYRKLADKYGIDQATISRKAKKEDWVSKRQHHLSKMQAKVLTADIKQKVSRAEKLQNVTDKLLSKVEAVIDSGEFTAMDTQGMKHLSGILKDIKEIQMLKSQKDLEEQDARIAKLRKEAEKDDKEKSSITITLEGGLSDYAQ
jgi:tRNA-dihydrouridine synthase